MQLSYITTGIEKIYFIHYHKKVVFEYETIAQVVTVWLIGSGIQILGIIIGTVILRKFGDRFIDQVLQKSLARQPFPNDEARDRRQKTLSRIFNTTFDIVILLIAILIILSEVGINITPIIAGAGIIGVAVGFGGQYLIRDLISGIFIILDNQYRVGDVVCVDKTCGIVEDISLRMTILRDLDGAVHHVPNGEVRIASNLTKGFSRLHLNIGVAYNSNLEKVIEIVNKVGKDMAKDKDWMDKIISPPEFLRVNEFGESAITIKILGDTKTLSKWEVEGEYRRRLKEAFDKNGIEIPFPQRVLHQVEEKKK